MSNCWAIALLVMALQAGPSSAQVLPVGISPGMEEAALRQALPDLDRIRRPHRAPGGGVGLWRLPRVASSGFQFEETFYIHAEVLQQIELVLLPQQPEDTSALAFAAMVDSLRAVYGPELAARSPGPGFVQESASWATGEQDVIATRSGNPQNPTVRFVWRLRVTRDASEL